MIQNHPTAMDCECEYCGERATRVLHFELQVPYTRRDGRADLRRHRQWSDVCVAHVPKAMAELQVSLDKLGVNLLRQSA